jgi:hypothetical protein
VTRKIGKTYIKKEKKLSFLITLITLVVVGMVIAVIELLPGDVPELGYSEQNGLGRSFMYPFVFTDGHDQLFIMKEDNSVVTVDNNVSYSLHDSAYEKVYYIRNTMIYEYSIKTNDRVALCDNAKEFSLLGNRRGIVYTDTSNRLLLYLFKGEENVLLSTEGNTELPYYVVSDEGVVFADGQTLKYCDYFGESKVITENLNTLKKFYISSDNEYICYYEENTLILSRSNAKQIKKLENGQMILCQEETALMYPTTNELKDNDGVPFNYFLSNIEQVDTNSNKSGTYKTGVLQYFNGNKFTEIATDIYKVIYYSQEDNFLLYTVLNGDKMDVYMTSKGGTPKKHISCDINNIFLFDNRTNYLYYRDAEGMLWRYDIYDTKHKTVKLAEDISNIYDYYNKPFVAYTDKEQQHVYLILKDKIERTDADYDIRLYGRSHETYLLCRRNSNGLMTLDYVFEDRLTRIANNVGLNVYFDRDLEYAVYNENSKMYIWHNGEIICIGDYEAVKAVDII